jgi:acetyl esterase
MALDPQAQTFLDYLKSLNTPPMNTLSPEKNRKGASYLLKKTSIPSQPVASVEDRLISVENGKIKLRIYTPERKEPLPMLVFFHGGGWVVGDLDSTDAPLRAIANDAHRIVVSVEYRLAPEHKFPTAVNDCYHATKWTAENASVLGGDPQRIAVGGESAGGNLAAVICLISRDKGFPLIEKQVLLYPATDFSTAYPSRTKYNGYFLTKEDLHYFENQYLRTEKDRENVYASPNLARDLSGLPSALVITAEYDPLHDEGKAYAERLKKAGIEVTYQCYKGMIHGFFCFGGIIDQGIVLLKQIANYLKKEGT